MVAQAMVVLIAAYDTTSATLAFTAWELTMNPEVQERYSQSIENFL